ncbi:MAG: hypothetical protein HY296_07980 [Thaumarchaeota archaeon]|nr:hypothetical protein [Nitrososphaerota archaeon]
MNRVCVVTSSPTAYYLAVSRLRNAGIRFSSFVPGEVADECDLVITTSAEAESFGRRALVLDGLSEDPAVFKGQVLARLADRPVTVLIGVDPGVRTGMAVFYGEESLAFYTFDSIEKVCSKVLEFLRMVPTSHALVRVGNGNLPLAMKIASQLNDRGIEGTIEMVNESGTSDRATKIKGIQGDQSAAAKIAFRKGAVFSPGGSRIRRKFQPGEAG